MGGTLKLVWGRSPGASYRQQIAPNIIASRASGVARQSQTVRMYARLDCFASLAMTGKHGLKVWPRVRKRAGDAQILLGG